MAPHSSILAWRIPWTEESGRLYIVHGVAKRQTRLSDFHTHTSSHLGIKIQMSTLGSRTANITRFLLSVQGSVRTNFKILKVIFFKGLIKSLHLLHTKSKLCMSKKPILTLISTASHSCH